MHQETRPLPDTHPEFTILRWPGFVEYRVAHFRLARDGSGRIVCGTCVWSWIDVGVVLFLSLLVHAWVEAQRHASDAVPALARLSPHLLVLILGITSTYLLWTRFTQVLHESLLVFPNLGIQLETHRGHPLLGTLHTTRHFIPLSALEDVVLHEGFRRWNVRYYLAAIQRRGRPLAGALAMAAAEAEAEAGDGDGNAGRIHLDDPSASPGAIEIHVAFENILPYFPVLKAVYLGVHETLFPPEDGVVETTEK